MIRTPTLNRPHPPRDSVFMVIRIAFVFIVVVFFVVVVFTPISTFAESSPSSSSLLLLSLPSPSPFPSTTITRTRTECFVDVNNGNDTDTCGNETNPCKSIGACMSSDIPKTLPPQTWLYPGKYVGRDSNCLLAIHNMNATLKARIPNSYVEIDCQFSESNYNNVFLETFHSSLHLEGLIISNTWYALSINDNGDESDTNTTSSIVNCTINGAMGISLILSYGSLSIINSTFINSGSFYSSDIFISNSQFINSRSVSIYGALAVTVISSSFISNYATSTNSRGSALDIENDYAIPTAAHIENCTFDGNKADLGGAIYTEFLGTLNITSTVFLNNNATKNGSALYIQLSSPKLIEIETNVYLNNVTFVNNSVASSSQNQQQQGGTIFISSSRYNTNVKPYTWNNVLIENNLGDGIILNKFDNFIMNFTITGVTLSNNIPFNLQCVDSINFTFCSSACVAKTCSACPGSCDISKNDKLPVCHHFASLPCSSPQSYCVYPSLSPPQQHQQPTCACINENMMGENCNIPIHNENNNNNNNKSCKNGSCWYIGLIVGIVVLISFPFIVYFVRKYHQRKKYSPLEKLIQDHQ